MRLILSLTLLLAVGFVSNGEDKKSSVRELPAPKVKAEGKATEPTTIASEEELKKALPDAKVEVDFTKEKLILFRWSGSGGDKLSHEGDEKNVVFRVQRGKTFDLRPHVHLYAVPKDAEVKVVSPK